MWSGKIEDYILYEDMSKILLYAINRQDWQCKMHQMIGDMESALKNYLYKKEPGKMPYLGIVHRLDQPVEGILSIAHTPFAAKELSRQILGGQMEKIYTGSDKRESRKKKRGYWKII